MSKPYPPLMMFTDVMQKIRSSYNPAIIVVLFLLVNVLVLRWQDAADRPTIDYYTFWSVPRALSLQQIGNIYSPEGQREIDAAIAAASPTLSEKQQYVSDFTKKLYASGTYVTCSPFLYSVVGLLSSGVYDRDQLLFVTICLLCLILSIFLISYLLRFPLISACLLLIFLSMYYAPISFDVDVGGVNQIQLLMLTLFVAFFKQSRYITAGVLMGTGIMFKPNIFLIFVLAILTSLVDKEYRKLSFLCIGAALGGLIAFTASIAYFGTPLVWVQFVKSLPNTLNLDFLSLVMPFQNGNFGLAMQIYVMTEKDLSLLILVVLLTLFALILVLTRQKRNAHDDRTENENDKGLHDAFVITGLGSAIMVLYSPLAWFHYHVLILPLTLYLLRSDFLVQNQKQSLFTARALAVCSLFMLTTMLASENPDYEATLANISAILLVILALLELERNRRMAYRAVVP